MSAAMVTGTPESWISTYVHSRGSCRLASAFKVSQVVFEVVCIQFEVSKVDGSRLELSV